MSDHCSLDGNMLRVRSCTERSGVWIEKFFPADSGARQAKAMRGDEEPDDYMFIPHDIRAAVAHDIANEELEVDPQDDEYAMNDED